MSNRFRTLYRIMYIGLILLAVLLSVAMVYLKATGVLAAVEPFKSIDVIALTLMVTAAAMLGFGLWFWLGEERILKP